MDTEPVDQASALVDPAGRALRTKDTGACPSCRANRDRRVLSGGFGEPHDVCGQCGHEFQERTL